MSMVEILVGICIGLFALALLLAVYIALWALWRTMRAMDKLMADDTGKERK